MPITFPNEMYCCEIWKYVTNDIVKNVIPNRYQISTFGRLFDTYNGKYYPTDNVKSNSYVLVHIRFIDGNYKTLKMHHLVLKAFCPLYYTDDKYSDVDHKDGIRYHNWIWNLEMVTHQENIIRCVKNGQYPLAENQQNSILTNNQVRMICDLISKGYRNSDIIKILKEEIPVLSKHLISDIKFRRNYKTISAEYNFSNMSYNKTSDKKISR